MTVEAPLHPDTLRADIERGSAPVILDVRSPAEFATGRIPGAVNVPFWRVLLGGDPPLPSPDHRIVVYCGHGPRATLAAAALRRRGFTRVACLAGHMTEWRRRGLPQERG